MNTRTKERRKDPRGTNECNGCSRPVRIPRGASVVGFWPCVSCVPSLAPLIRERQVTRKIKHDPNAYYRVRIPISGTVVDFGTSDFGAGAGGEAARVRVLESFLDDDIYSGAYDEE